MLTHMQPKWVDFDVVGKRLFLEQVCAASYYKVSNRVEPHTTFMSPNTVSNVTDAGVHGAPWHIHHQVQAERRSRSKGHDEQGRRVVSARWDQHAGDARRVRHLLHSVLSILPEVSAAVVDLLSSKHMAARRLLDKTKAMQTWVEAEEVMTLSCVLLCGHACSTPHDTKDDVTAGNTQQ